MPDEGLEMVFPAVAFEAAFDRIQMVGIQPFLALPVERHEDEVADHVGAAQVAAAGVVSPSLRSKATIRSLQSPAHSAETSGPSCLTRFSKNAYASRSRTTAWRRRSPPGASWRWRAVRDASEVKGWGSHEFRALAHEGKWYRLRRWALDYRRFHGDPGNPELWENLAEFIETPIPHATGPLLRPVTVSIDIGGHYGAQVAEFVKTRGQGCQCLKGLPPARFGAVLARRSVTADSLATYGPDGLMLVCGNTGKASAFSD